MLKYSKTRKQNGGGRLGSEYRYGDKVRRKSKELCEVSVITLAPFQKHAQGILF